MGVKHLIKKCLNQLPYVKSLYEENTLLKKSLSVPPGHFYSPINDLDYLRKVESRIWPSKDIEGILGIDLNTQEQIELTRSFEKYYNDLPFKSSKQNNLRYYYDNDFYLYTDAIFLYSMMRTLKPKSIIEIGSGFSSAVMLDTNQLFFDNGIKLTFVEPYPDRLYSLISESDKANTQIVVQDIQSVDLSIFEKLEKNDILFIDSSHVAKTGSDVNHILFNIIPRLQSGVFIHIHDIFYPFEYPKDWIYKKRSWNEDYFIKAFLMYNSQFKIRLFSDYLHKLHGSAFKSMPLCYNNSGGNLWIEKL